MVLIFGSIILLVGIYAVLRVLINFSLPNYPQSGVLAFNTTGNPPIVQRASDCNYPRSYYSDDGKTLRPPTEAESKQDTQDKDRCLQGIAETVKEVKMDDIGIAAFFVFVGLGLFVMPRFLPQK